MSLVILSMTSSTTSWYLLIPHSEFAIFLLFKGFQENFSNSHKNSIYQMQCVSQYIICWQRLNFNIEKKHATKGLLLNCYVQKDILYLPAGLGLGDGVGGGAGE